MSPIATMLVQFACMALSFVAAWVLRHYTMPQADPAAPATPADPTLPNFTGVLGPILKAVEQQILVGIAGHVGGIFQMPVAAPGALPASAIPAAGSK